MKPIFNKYISAFVFVMLLSISFSQDESKRLKFGAGLIYTPSYNLPQHFNTGNINPNSFETIKNEEMGRFVHPVVLYFSYDPIERIRLKLGFGTQFFGYKSPVYKSELENNQVQEVSYKVSNRYFQIPLGIQFFMSKSIYLEASYVPLLLINTKQETHTITEGFEHFNTYISKKGYERYNQMIDFSIGYQAKLGESSISLQIAPKVSYSPSFVELPQSQINRKNWQFGLSVGIHSFL